MQPLVNLSAVPADFRCYFESYQASNSLFNYLAGLGILVLNKFRHEIKGYTSARGFNFEDINRAINYDLKVIRRWMDYLEAYAPGASALQGKNVLELGPGADLGIGLIMLAEGVKSYNAMDVHNLTQNTPAIFYDVLFKRLQQDPYLKTSIEELKHQFRLFNQNRNDRLNYIIRKDFNLTPFENNNIDLVVSNSAFQQFDNPTVTIQQLNKVVSPGAYFIALIDLKTHTRWIKSRDPLNIYRYTDQLYNIFRFRGSQNRVRPYEFQNILEKNGWKNVKIFPRIVLNQSHIQSVKQSLNPRFQGRKNQMELLACLICAQKE